VIERIEDFHDIVARLDPATARATTASPTALFPAASARPRRQIRRKWTRADRFRALNTLKEKGKGQNRDESDC
jgi:hypothetical protein